MAGGTARGLLQSVRFREPWCDAEGVHAERDYGVVALRSRIATVRA